MTPRHGEDGSRSLVESGGRLPSSGAESKSASRPVGTQILKVRKVCKRYGGVNALTDVAVDLYAGEVVALVGDNGAGKSTFAKIISGIEYADSGEIEFEGKRVHLNSPQAAASVGIQTVYQDLALCDTLDTVQNLFLGKEIRRTWYQGFRLARAEMETTTQRVLANLGAKI
ncbi:MAG: sugar ABC transporter ATP-binding protein, partial [Nitratireductor sp.]|nr:sugar ABC transporter ATP-binding protein [Nitratireductor sp.]